MIDPVDQQPVKKRLRNKGRQARRVWTVAGRVKVMRRWWSSRTDGSVAPLDAAIDGLGGSVSPGVREMACRLNNDGTSFDRTASNLERTAQIRLSKETVRQLVLCEGEAVLSSQRQDAVRPAFTAADCRVEPESPESASRIYVGVDGVMVPVVTDAEKVKRREKVVQKRRSSGRRGVPLSPRTQGAKESFKEFKVVTFYDERGAHWHEAFSSDSRTRLGSLIRREARRLQFSAAAERIANVDGASWIRDRLVESQHEMRLDGMGLDFYHLSENVHKARRRVFGEQSEEGRRWADELMHVFRHEGYEAAWDRLVSWRSATRGTKRKAADRLLNYAAAGLKCPLSSDVQTAMTERRVDRTKWLCHMCRGGRT